MHAEESRLRTFIEPAKQFIIPLFQRFYVWEKPYWSTLWSDLLDLIEDSDPDRTHFLGSMVVIPATDSTPSLPRFIIIDGQQRLATLQVLLALLRDHAHEDGESTLAQEIEQTLLVNNFKTGDDHHKLRLSQSDRIAFQAILQAQTPLPKHRLSDCYAFFKQKLKRDEPALRVLFEAIAHQLSIVAIVLAATDNPYLVFESLNFKGQKLTEADLIRNYLFMRIPSIEQEPLYHQYWFPMEQMLGEHLTDFVRHDLMRSGAFVKQSEVYVTLKNRLVQGDARDALRQLATFADYYARLLFPESQEPDPTLAAGLHRLNRLEATTVYPFLLNVYHDYTQGILSAGEFAEVLAVLENYLIRRFVSGLPTSHLNKTFPVLYAKTRQLDVNGFVPALQRTLQNKGYPGDPLFRSRLPELRLYGQGTLPQKAKFILETLECRAIGQTRTFDYATLEHVMPQTLTDEWRAHLGDDWSVTHELHLHTLGNLTLTTHNSALSNAPFAEKRELLLNSQLGLNHYFQNVRYWRKTEIQQRAVALTEQAIQCWLYFGDAGATVADSDEVIGTTPESVTLLGQTFPVKRWREVLATTLDALADQKPDQFATVLAKYPHYVAVSPQAFRAPKPFNNGYYIESHFSAAGIYRFCQRAVETMGLPPEAWSVQIKPVVADTE